MVDGSDRSAQDIVSKLKFIAQIKEGEKIDVQSLKVVPDHWISKLYRTLVARGESREATLEFIRGVVGEAFDLISEYLPRDQGFFQQIGYLIVQSLQDAKVGLVNLGQTYHEDRMFFARLDTLIETINTKTEDINRQFTMDNYPDQNVEIVTQKAGVDNRRKPSNKQRSTGKSNE